MRARVHPSSLSHPLACLTDLTDPADVNANLADGVFRQYAVLPLDLFAASTPLQLAANTDSVEAAAARAAAEGPAAAEARAMSDASAGSNTREGRSAGQQAKASSGELNAANVRAMLLELPEYTDLAALGIGVLVVEAVAEDGKVVLSYAGPANLRRAVQLNLSNTLRAADTRVRQVEFVDA